METLMSIFLWVIVAACVLAVLHNRFIQKSLSLAKDHLPLVRKYWGLVM